MSQVPTLPGSACPRSPLMSNVRLHEIRSPVMVVVVWETWLNDGAEAEGPV